MEQNDAPSFAYLKHPTVWIVTGIRFAAALYILINPFWGFVWSVIFDILDAQVLIHYLGILRSEYHLWDKNVDWFAYVTEFLVAIGYGLYLPFFLLLFLRFMGQFMFMRTEKTVYFALFPNFFEVAFLWLIIFHPVPGSIDIFESGPLAWLVALLIGKEIHEVALHYVWPRFMLPHVEDIERNLWEQFVKARERKD